MPIGFVRPITAAIFLALATAGPTTGARAEEGGGRRCLEAPMRTDFKAIVADCGVALAAPAEAGAPAGKRRAMLQRLGEAQFWARDYEGARTTFGLLLNEVPKDSQALSWRSWANVRLFAFGEAAEEGLAAVQGDGKCVQCWRSYGDALYGLGRRREGLAALQQALQLEPDNWFSAHQLALYQANNGNLIDALHTLDARIAQPVDPSTPVFWIDKDGRAVDPLGLLLDQRGALRARFSDKGQAALEDLDAAASRGYSNEDQLDQIARVMAYNRIGRNQEALALVDELLQRKTNCECSLYLEKARALKALGRPGDALAAYDAAVKARPDEALGYWARGWFHAASGRRAEAHDDLMRAIQMDPSLLVSFKNEMKGHDFYFGALDTELDPGVEDALAACLISSRCSRRVQG